MVAQRWGTEAGCTYGNGGALVAKLCGSDDGAQCEGTFALPLCLQHRSLKSSYEAVLSAQHKLSLRSMRIILSLLQVVKRAAQALGYVCSGHPAAPGVLLPAVDALLALRTSKSEEVLFAAGEALCFAFGGESG